MFCPKCGMQNSDTGKFCRSCGTDLGNVSAALTGTQPAHFNDAGAAMINNEAKRRQDSSEVFGDAVKSIISGVGFLIVAIALLTSGVAGGHAWWWAMLFPAFGLLSKGISDYLKSKKMEQREMNLAAPAQNVLNNSVHNASLPSSQINYVQSDSRYKTGDLVPPSVTDNTTRHLEMNSEGETMTLPKR